MLLCCIEDSDKLNKLMKVQGKTKKLFRKRVYNKQITPTTIMFGVHKDNIL